MTSRFQKLELETSHQPQVNAHLLSTDLAEMHDSAYWLKQADQNRRQGQFEDALRQYSRAVELDRATVAGWVGQVQMLIALGEYPEAELWARKALELFHGHADLTAARAQSICREGKIERRCRYVTRHWRNRVNPRIDGWLAGTSCWLAKDNVEQHCFDKAAQLDPDWLVLLEIGAIYTFYRRYAKALVRCRQAVEKAPDQPHAWYQRARCEQAVGMIGIARQSYRQCLDLQPKHSQARQELLKLDSEPRSLLGRAYRKLFARG